MEVVLLDMKNKSMKGIVYILLLISTQLLATNYYVSNSGSDTTINFTGKTWTDVNGINYKDSLTLDVFENVVIVSKINSPPPKPIVTSSGKVLVTEEGKVIVLE